MSSSPAAAASTLAHNPGASTGRGRRSSRAGTNGSKRKGIANAGGPNANSSSPDNSGSDEELESIIPAGADIGGGTEPGRKTRSSSSTPTNGPNPVVANSGYPRRTGKRENSTHSNHSGSREPSSVQGGDGCQQRRSCSRERSRSGNKSSIGIIEPISTESTKQNEADSTKTNGEQSEEIKSTQQTTLCTSTPIRTTRATRMSSLEENGNRSSRDADEEDYNDMDVSSPVNTTNSMNDNKANGRNNRITNNLNKSRGKRKSSAANSENSDSENNEDECPSETIINSKQSSSTNAKERDFDDKSVSIRTNSEVAVPDLSENTLGNLSPNGKLNGPTKIAKKRGRPRKNVNKLDSSSDDKPKSFEEFKRQVEANLRVEDGRHAEVVDERSIRCLCKKIIRTCSRFNWSYLIQKPKVRNGVVYQKGHWFACADVAKGISCIKPSDKICGDDNDDSNETESTENSTSSGLPTDLIGRLSTRRVVKRVTDDKKESSSKRARNTNYSEIDEDDFEEDEEEDENQDDDEGDSDEESSEESSEEEDEEEDTFSLYKNISTLLESRVPGEIFLQDGPCFQMAHDNIIMCHVCKYMPKAERRDMLRRGNFDDPDCEISCCFYSFRKLRHMKSGNMVVVGYLDPEKDVKDLNNANISFSSSSISMAMKGNQTKAKAETSLSLSTVGTKSLDASDSTSQFSSGSPVDDSSIGNKSSTTPVSLPDDMSIWRGENRSKMPLPSDDNNEDTKDFEKTKFILGLIGDQFCDMVLQEQKCLTLNKEQSDNKQVVWKKAVKGVREMCDVCKTTLFNHHWTCGRCGIYICLDCYKFRLGGLVKDQAPLESSFTDEYNWPLCTNGEEHKIEKLLLAQIIPKNALVDLANTVHEVRDKWGISQFCHRPREFSNVFTGDGLQNSRAIKSINPERAAKLYYCVFCPGASFKWQSELYKHCLFRHFIEEVKASISDDPPFKCPETKCEYIGATKTAALCHYGITHKVVAKHIEEAIKKDPSLEMAKTSITASTSSLPNVPTRGRGSIKTPSDDYEAPFKCLMCTLSVSSGQRNAHLCRHFHDTLSADLPVKAPFECPKEKCRFVGIDRLTLIRHYGGYHGLVDQYLKDYLTNKGEHKASSTLTADVRDKGASSGNPTNDNSGSDLMTFSSSTTSIASPTSCIMTVTDTTQSLKTNVMSSFSSASTQQNNKMINEAIEGSVTATTNGNGSSSSGLKNNAVGNNNLSSSTSNNNNSSGGIECRLCEPGNNSTQSQKVLKNNVDLYQHLSELHFSEKLLEEVLVDVPSNTRPFQCPQPGCQFTSMTKSGLVPHVGVHHRFAVKYYYQVMGMDHEKDWRQVDISSSASNLSFINTGNNGVGGRGAGRPSSTSSSGGVHDYANKESCPICNEKFVRTALLFHVAQHHFTEKLLNRGIKTTSPYSCPMCPHFSEHYAGLLRHYLTYHKQMEILAAEVLGKPIPEKTLPPPTKDIKKEEQDMEVDLYNKNPLAATTDLEMDGAMIKVEDIKEETNDISSPSTKQATTQNIISNPYIENCAPARINVKPNAIESTSVGGHACLMCDDVKKIVGSTQGDFSKHLVEVHFREKLLSKIPNTPVKNSTFVPNLDSTTPNNSKKFGCPFPSCSFEHQYRWQVAKHYGIKHKFAITFYEEVTGTRVCKTSTSSLSSPQLPPIMKQETAHSSLHPLSPSATAMPTSSSLPSANPPQQQALQCNKMSMPNALKSKAPASYPISTQQTNSSVTTSDISTVSLPTPTTAVDFDDLDEKIEDVDEEIDEEDEIMIDSQLTQLGTTSTRESRDGAISFDQATDNASSGILQFDEFDKFLHDDEHTMDDTTSPQKSSSSTLNPSSQHFMSHNTSSGMDDSLSSADQTLGDDSLLSPTDGSLLQTHDCKICAVKCRGMSEYLKHLSKVHFKHKLLSMVTKTAPFRCPWNACEVTKKDRFNLALHYGMTHKVSLRLMQDMPNDAMNEEVEATCKLCHQSFTAHRYLYTHLSDSHFQNELDLELPKTSPWKCPKCPYTGNEPRSLRVHYGVRHKIVLNHLAVKLGINIHILKKEMKAGRKKAVSALKASMGCKFCPTTFKNVNDQAKHVVMHLRNELYPQLPEKEPFSCPKCEFCAQTRMNLLLHYGTIHVSVVKELLEKDRSELNIDMSFVGPEKTSTEGGAASMANQESSSGMTPSSVVDSQVISGGGEATTKSPARRVGNTSTVPNQRQQAEDKKFPKCRICNYRYFTRLDLCRHFVDFHLRERLTNCLDPYQTRCPACTLSYERHQSRLRHFIWSHQDLEALVIETQNVRLSEFMPSTRDLEIVKQKNEKQKVADGQLPGLSDERELKDITDLAALPVYSTIDAKLSIPSCELCGEEFKHSVNKTRDKGVHLLSHFREEVMLGLPTQKPFKCPKCTFLGRDLVDLGRHCGLSHRVVFKLMQKELGEEWELEGEDSNECRMCNQVFPNLRALTDHYCTQHFYRKLSADLPTEPPFKCATEKCNYSTKTQLGLVRHIGQKHGMVKKLLREEGFNSNPGSVKRRRTTDSQDSTSQFDILNPQPMQQQQSPINNPQHPPLHQQQTLPISEHQHHIQQRASLPPHMQQSPQPLHSSSIQQPSPHQHPSQQKLPPQQYSLDPHLQHHQQQQPPPPHYQHPQQQTTQPPQQPWDPYQAQQPLPPPTQHMPYPQQQQRQPPQTMQSISSVSSQQQQHHSQLASPTSQQIGQQPHGQHLEQQPQYLQQPHGHHQQNFPPQQQPAFPLPLPQQHGSQPQPSHQQFHTQHTPEQPPHPTQNVKAQVQIQSPQPQQEKQPEQQLMATNSRPPSTTPSTTNEITGPTKPDVKASKQEQSPVACPICNNTFLNGTHFLRHAADKHFFERLRADLPNYPPFKCPQGNCTFEGKDVKLLVRHYGINHKMVVKILNERAGKPDSYDDSIVRTFETSESNRESCPLCTSNFGGRYMLLRHLADCHFRERLCEGVQTGEVYKCPQCAHESKDKGGFVRHYGLVHKMVQKWLKEMGIHGYDDESRKAQLDAKRQASQAAQMAAKQQDNLDMESYPDFKETYEPNAQFFDNPNSVGALSSFAPPSTPSSTTSYADQQQQQAAFASTTPQPPSIGPVQPNQYYSSPPAIQTQFNDTTASGGNLPSQYSPASALQQRPPSQPPARPFSNNPLTSPTTPQSMSPSQQNIQMQQQGGYDQGYYVQPGQSNPQPTHFSGNAPSYFNQANRPNGIPQGQVPPGYLQQQPLTPQTPQASITPQPPMTPQPMTPGSHGAQTPQPPLTPQDQQNNGMMSPSGSYIGYEQTVNRPPPPQAMAANAYRQPIVPHIPSQPPGGPPQQSVYGGHQQPQPLPSQQIARPITLQPQDSPRSSTPNSGSSAAVSKKTSQAYVPPGDDYIQPPGDGIPGPYAIQCNFCKNMTKNKSDFYRHLSERHFKAELARELPTTAPFKCPLHPCAYETKDNTVAPLIKHYGIVHKSVQKFIRGQIAGRYVHHDPKSALNSKPSSTEPQFPPTPQQHLQVGIPQSGSQSPLVNGIQPMHDTTLPQAIGSNQGPNASIQLPIPLQQQNVQTISNTALKVKCPFCELMFAARYAFYQHLCDRHFKDAIAQQVPLNAPFQCPVSGCGYVAKDSRQSLVRHYGMTHKVVVDLLKRHAPDYANADPFPADGPAHLEQSELGIIPPSMDLQHQENMHSQQSAPAQQQHAQVQPPFYHQQEQFHYQDQQRHHMLPHHQQPIQLPQQQAPVHDPMNSFAYPGYQTQESQLHPPIQHHLPHQQQSQQHHLQQPYNLAMPQQQPTQNQSGEMRFEPQIDGTFDPSHYSDHSSVAGSSVDGSRSIPTTPVKAPPPSANGIAQSTNSVTQSGGSSILSMKASSDQDSLLLTLAVPESAVVVNEDGQQSVNVDALAAAVSAAVAPHSNRNNTGAITTPPPHLINGGDLESSIEDLKLSMAESVVQTPEDIISNNQLQNLSIGSKSQKTSPTNTNSSITPPFATPASTPVPQPNSASTNSNVQRGAPKMCEICGKQFEGKNRAMLKVQHMAHHFKDKLFADLADKSPPFKCPVAGCSYSTKHKPDWARHYGSVHQYISKYLKEYMEENKANNESGQTVSTIKTEPGSVEHSPRLQNPLPLNQYDQSNKTMSTADVTDGERTYSAFLPTGDLSKILMTAMDQQNQPMKNFGVVTVTGPVVNKLQQAGLSDKLQTAGVSQNLSNPAPPAVASQVIPQIQIPLTHQNVLLQQQQHPQQQSALISNYHHVGNGVSSIASKMKHFNSLDSDSNAADLNLVEQVIQHSTKIDPTTGILSQPSSSGTTNLLSNHHSNVNSHSPQQCFICPNGPWFKDEKDLNHHISTAHLDIDVKPNTEGENSNNNLEVLSVDDLEASFLQSSNSPDTMSSDFPPMIKDLFDDNPLGKVLPSSGFSDISQHQILANGPNPTPLPMGKVPMSSEANVSSVLQGSNQASSSKTTSRSTTAPTVGGRGALPTGRPCEICGFEPKTKNKSRERQDHLAMKHYRERIQSDLTEVTNFQCPLCDYVGKDKQTIYRHYTGKHKVVEQYLADDIRDGKIIPLSPEQMKNAQQNLSVAKDTKQTPRNSICSEGNIPNLPTTVEALPSIPDFSDAACLDLDPSFEPTSVAASGTSSNGSNGLGLTIHSLVDSSRLSLGDFMDSEPLTCVQDRIMQVDGGDDDLTEEDSDDDDDAMIKQLDGALGDDEMGSEPDGFEEDSSNLSASSGSGDSRCPICDEPTKMHKTYHLATKHFRDRLLKELPGEKPFKCPECDHESKTKINMWTHYLGKHRYGAKWMAEILEQKQKGTEMAPPPKVLPTSFEPGNFRQQFTAQQGTPPQVPPQPYLQPPYIPPQQQHYYQQTSPNQPYQPPYSNQQQYQHPDSLQQQLPSMLASENSLMSTKQHHKMAINPGFNHPPGAYPIGNIQPPTGQQLSALPPVQGPVPSNVAIQQQPKMIRNAGAGLPNSLSDNVIVEHPTMLPTSTLLPPTKSVAQDSLSHAKSSIQTTPNADVKIEEDTKPPIAFLQGQHQQTTSTTPTTSTPLSSTTKKPGVAKDSYVPTRKDNTFWCDLCQVTVNVAKVHHFVSAHFQERLRKILPCNPPFHCPLCRHEGKHFFNLSTHFLKQHNVMESWIRKALEQLEDEAIAKAHEREAKGLALDGSEDHKGSKHYISSGEEVDTSDDERDANENEKYRTFIGMLSESGMEDRLLKSEPIRRRKRYKKCKTTADFYQRAFEDLANSDDSTDQYSTVFRRHQHKSREMIPARIMTDVESRLNHPDVPHHWLCTGKLLVLEDPNHLGNLKLFQENWIRGQPIIVQNVSKQLDQSLWTPSSFRRRFGHEKHPLINTKSGKTVPNVPLKLFWDGFENLNDRMLDENGMPMLLKLKDWPTDNDFSNFLPENFEDLMSVLPIKDYTLRTGHFNLASMMPDFFVRPDLGPKMYIAYGNALHPDTGTTNLHLDMSDAMNLMVHVGLPNDGDKNEHFSVGLKSCDLAGTDILTAKKLREDGKIPGAMWHIYHPRDADKIRDMLNKVSLENGQRLEPNTDPIHDQRVYLDTKLRKRLYEEYGVVGYAFPQCEGDVVFIPAGAPHQVRNIHNCIKIAEDFVSPENLEWCFYQTEEFRHLSDTHTNHEDKLQIKMILYHAVKECVATLENYEKTHEGQTC